LSDAAVARSAPRIAALGTDGLLPTNRDPQRVADLILKVLPVFEQHRALLEATYKAFDFSRLDGLKDAAYAAKYHNGSAHAAPPAEDAVPAAMAEAVATRQMLTAVARQLVIRKKLSSRVIDDTPNRNGYSDVAADIMRLVTAFRAAWDVIATPSGMTKEEVDAALSTADALSEAVSKREKADARFAAGSLLKQQSFTLMVRDYDYVRSALVFPLAQAGKPGIETFAPSVYAVKQGRKSAPDEATEETQGSDGSAQDVQTADDENAPKETTGNADPAPGFPGLAHMGKPFL
jgi:hypothetical protein